MSLRMQLAGAGMVVGLVGIVGLAFAQFGGVFESTSTVTVSAPRAGLVLEPDAKVKLRGVQIGRVTGIDISDGRALLTLAMQPNSLALVPKNVKVDIESTTVFGAKFVNFEVPADPSPAHLTAGTELAAGQVTVEYDTLFQHLTDLLGKVQPDKVNATLDALATALHGRGADIGDMLTTADTYLKTMNPELPTVQRDMSKTADVANLYADSAPDLLATIRNLTSTSDSIVAEQNNLSKVLLAVMGVNDPGNVGAVLRDNEQRLDTVLDVLRPSTALLDRYSPVLNCVVIGLDRVQPLANQIFGGGQEGVALNAGLEWGSQPYRNPPDLPKVHATGGPNCMNLTTIPLTMGQPNAPWVVTDTSEVPYIPATRTNVDPNNLFRLLYPFAQGVSTPTGGGK